MNQETDRNNYYDRARFGGGGGSFRGRIRNGFFKQRRRGGGGGGVLLEEGYGMAFLNKEMNDNYYQIDPTTSSQSDLSVKMKTIGQIQSALLKPIKSIYS